MHIRVRQFADRLWYEGWRINGLKVDYGRRWDVRLMRNVKTRAIGHAHYMVCHTYQKINEVDKVEGP